MEWLGERPAGFDQSSAMEQSPPPENSDGRNSAGEYTIRSLEGRHRFRARQAGKRRPMCPPGHSTAAFWPADATAGAGWRDRNGRSAFSWETVSAGLSTAVGSMGWPCYGFQQRNCFARRRGLFPEHILE